MSRGGRTLKIHTWCQYHTSSEGRTQAAWSANKFVRCVKGEGVNGTGLVPVAGANRNLTASTSQQEAIDWFVNMVEERFPQLVGGFATWIPVPPSHATSRRDVEAGTTGQIARALAQRGGIHDVDAGLYWKRPITPARRGGSRDPFELFEKLVCEPARKWDQAVILVDDVFTTGGHVVAAEARLDANEVVCSHAFCVGRSNHGECEAEPFSYQHASFDAIDVGNPLERLFWSIGRRFKR